MEPTDLHAIRIAARAAYERGRVKHALRYAPIVTAIVTWSLLTNTRPVLSLTTGVVLVLSVVGMDVAGTGWARAVVPGLLAAIPPLVLPLLMRGGGHCCVDGSCYSWCMLGCIGGGLLTGLTIGVAARAAGQQRTTLMCGATWLAGLGGMLGCTIAGSAGIAAMLAATIAVSVPVVALTRPVMR